MNINVKKGFFIGIALSVIHILITTFIPDFTVDRSLYYVVGSVFIFFIILFLVSEKFKNFFIIGITAVLTIVCIQLLFYVVDQHGGWERVLRRFINNFFRLF